MDLTGQTIGGRYEIEVELGGGGMGRVYLARDVQLKGRAVVVKVPHADLLDEPFRRRFDGEIAQLIDLEHPGIIPIFDAGEHDGLPYLVVRYVAGGDLRERMPRGTRQSLEEVREWVEPIASALDYIHRTGRVHRDVKPGNILFDVEGHAYLSDFGIATVIAGSESGATASHMTGTGLFMGSPRYSPPEAAMRQLSPQYDQYSLGLMVYEALSGTFPFEGASGSELMWAKLQDAPRPVDSTGVGIRREVADAVMRAIDRDRERRHPSCRAFADALFPDRGSGRASLPDALERETLADSAARPPPALRRPPPSAAPTPPLSETAVEEDLGLDGAEVPPTLRVDVADALPDAVEPGPSPAPALRSSGGSSRRWGRAAVVAAASVAIAAAIVAVGPQVARWLETARSRAFAERPGAAERTGVEPVEPAGRAPLRAPAVPGEGQPSERAASRAPSTGGERAASPDREQTAARRPPAPPAPAKLTVRSNVSGDRFSVDGRVIGPTGSSVHEIEPGRHVVRVEKEGRIPWEETVEVTSGERRILLARLEEVEPVVADAPRPAADWIRVPGGEFFSGCNVQVDTECEAVEKPGRTRPVAAFSIDRTEVTVEAFALCVAAGACSEEGLTMPFWSGRPQAEWAFACNWGKEGWEQHPINCVDWYQARAFCTWRGARLPGEWEWEKAARGTDGRRYAWGSEGVETAGRVANLADLAAGRVRSDWAVTEDYDDGHYTTSPVGAFAAGASPYGALDMIGNVWEWTATPFESDPNRRVLRGGSWVDVPRYARASARIWADPHARNEDVGFRCAQ